MYFLCLFVEHRRLSASACICAAIYCLVRRRIIFLSAASIGADPLSLLFALQSLSSLCEIRGLIIANAPIFYYDKLTS